VSIIGFGNNTNKQAFNYQELTSIGGFDRSGINRWYTSGSGVQIGNVSLGGALEGYNLASGGGINVNHNLERSYLNFQYFFGGNDANLLRDGYVIQSLRDSTLNMITATDNGSKVNNHRMSLEWQFDKDSLNELELGTNFSFYTDREQDRSFSTTRSEFHFLNSNEKETDRDYRNMEIEAYGSYNRLSKNDKWNNYIRGNVSRNYRVNNNLSTSVLSFTEMNGADSLLRQFRFGDEVQDRLQFYAFSAYDLLDSLTVSLTYRPVLIRLDKVNDTYDRTESEEKYDSSLSNRIGSQSALQELTAALTWVRPHFSVTPQLTILKYDQMNTYGLNDVSSSIHDMRFMPGIRFRIGDWRISYRIEYEQPEIDQLNPLLDNRSLSSQSRGNPNLNSEMKHEISLYTNHYNPETFVYYYLYASLNNYSTAIVESQAILENGVFFRTPVNVSDKLNGFGGGTIRKTYKYENKNSFTFAFSSWSSFERQPVIINNIQREFTSLNIRPNLMFELNLKDRFELSQLFSYRYRANTQPDRESLVGETINSSTSAILRWPGRFMWRVSYDLNYTKFNSEDVPVNEFYLFNAEVFYNIDEKGKWQLNLKAYDILNQNQRVNTYSNENYIYFSQSNVLQRYFLLTLVYNIKSFGGTEVSARDRNFWWW
jgi:hypothetical protein